MIKHRFFVAVLAFAAVAGGAQADTAWEMFVARCLDPFEHQSVAIVDGLAAQPIDQMHEARRAFGPNADGYVLVVDKAPSVGERACGVEAATADPSTAERAWRYAQLSAGRYVPEGDWLVSNEWIEPRVMVRSDVSGVRASYWIVETDLES
ncbi:hypothetical protein [uncultured Tateyamaria sp.]|uniref:hypothetical protein n=1 Tax=uncultured Tateyamaria sp. TaxID=455651 RepID=UPI002601D0CB|nr:hypothetical protein [uncultured Tateyamaria sp.]